MKKLYSTFMIMALILVCTTARADDIFVYDDGTQLTISWSESEVDDAFYYEVILENKTDGSIKYPEELVFDPFIVISGLVYHNIYKITVKAYNNDGDIEIKTVGETYITFALDESSGSCVCVCPEFPKKVFFGLISPDWWTGIAINNAGNESQSVVITAGNRSKTVDVSSHSTEAILLEEIIDDSTTEYYPITYETDSPDVGVTVLIGDAVGFSFQN
jgi:hypothetical protein